MVAEDALKRLGYYANADDMLCCIPAELRSAIGDKLTGNESRALFKAIFALAFRCIQVGFQAGQARQRGMELSAEYGRIHAEVVADIIARLQGED